MNKHHPSEYAPPDVPIRRTPIDLPDDFGTDDANRGDAVTAIIGGLILLAVLIAAAVLIGAFS